MTENQIISLPASLLKIPNQMRQSGLQQIDRSLAEVTSILKNPRLSIVDRVIWNGRRRELLAARWLIDKLLPVKVVEKIPIPDDDLKVRESVNSLQTTTFHLKSTITPSPPRMLFDKTLDQLQSGLQNLTGSSLEIDILRYEKKRELLYLILRKLENILDELRYSQVQPNQLAQKLPIVLRDLWQESTTDFFGKYYTLLIGKQQIEVVNILLQDDEIIREAFLDKIPLLTDLFAYLLFQTPLVIESIADSFDQVKIIERLELLLQNLIIQVANAVIQPLLNHFADVSEIKQNFYDRRLMSTREITRFRNDLSWKYRFAKYIQEPKAIFESQHELLVLDDGGMKKISIYAPRTQELEELSGVQLVVTLALETRDAIAPRLRSAVTFIGSGVVYILTQVIGRGIGLIGRGIIQGIGSTLNETRFGKNNDRPK